MLQGRCECGKVQFELRKNLRDIIACHCTQCRRISGHFWAATAVAFENFVLLTQETLCWYRSSDFAQRGFCTRCGSTLFYKRDNANYIAVSAGCLDMPTNLKCNAHIFTADKGDYYTLNDEIACYESFSNTKIK